MAKKRDKATNAVADPETEGQTAEREEQAQEPTEQDGDVSGAQEGGSTAPDEDVAGIANDIVNHRGEATEKLDEIERNEALAPYIGADGRIEPVPYGVTLVPGKKVRAKVYTLKLKDITRDSRIQPRDKMSEETIKGYAELMREGTVFPPVVVFREEVAGGDEDSGITDWLADGWHRVYAAERAEQDTIRAEVYDGGINEAMLYAAGANAQHGLHRSNADKIRAVEMILNHPLVIEQQWSDNRIAKQAGVSHVTVGNVRRRLRPGDQPSHRLGHDGRIHNVQHRLDVRANQTTEAEEAQPSLYSCGVEGCPEVTAVPSVHCEECGAHYPVAEYDTCPTCRPAEVDSGNGHAPVVATITDEPLSVDEEPIELPDHGGSLPPISEAHAALQALYEALDAVEVYASMVNPNTVAVIVDETVIDDVLERIATHLDWMDGIEQGLKARRPTPATV